YLDDVARCGGKLGPERLPGRQPRARDDLGGALGRRLDVRTRDVELDCAHFLVVVQPRADLGVLVGTKASDRDPERQLEAPDTWQDLREEPIDAGIREADRVEHPE